MFIKKCKSFNAQIFFNSMFFGENIEKYANNYSTLPRGGDYSFFGGTDYRKRWHFMILCPLGIGGHKTCLLFTGKGLYSVI